MTFIDATRNLIENHLSYECNDSIPIDISNVIVKEASKGNFGRPVTRFMVDYKGTWLLFAEHRYHQQFGWGYYACLPETGYKIVGIDIEETI